MSKMISKKAHANSKTTPCCFVLVNKKDSVVPSGISSIVVASQHGQRSIEKLLNAEVHQKHELHIMNLFGIIISTATVLFSLA